MDIFISGIPKGLDPFPVSQHIRRSVETVAQVQDIWVHPTKGYGFITLFDATSTDLVLNLHNNISVNGGIVKLRRSRKQHVQKSVQSPKRINTFVQQSPYSGSLQSYGQSEYTNLGGYTTFGDYQRDRPCPDTLYNYVQQVPIRRKKKNKPWKDVTRRTTIPTPQPGSTGKIRKRHCRKRKKTRSRHNKDYPSQRQVHTSRRKLCTSTCKRETTTKSLPLNRKGSENNQQPVNCPDLKNMQLATDNPVGNLVVDHPRSEDSKPIKGFPLGKLLVNHPGSGDSKPIENVPVYPLVVSHPGPGERNPIENVPSEQLVVDHQSPGDINPIINIPVSHGVVDHTDPENFSHPSVCMDTDTNNILLPLVNVHFYDHSKYLFSADIANNNSVIEGLGNVIWIHCKIPQKSYNLIYNSKVLNQTFTPIIENESNIHIVVKGKGGMKEGDPPETKQQWTSTENDSDVPTGQQTNETVNLRSETDTINTEAAKRSKDIKYRSMQQAVVKALGLEKYFPNKMTKQEVMCIGDNEDKKPKKLTDAPWVILRKIIMLDKGGRDKIVKELYDIDDSETEDEEENDIGDITLEQIISKQVKLHPIDIFISIYLCLHPILQQHICTKMFSCHLAVPFIYKKPASDKRLMISLWPFREIIVNDGEIETSIVNCKQHVISFVRLGRPSISKSSIANLLLGVNNHHAFFNQDCKLGDTRKRLSEGLVEATWFIPSSTATEQELNDEEELNDVAMLLNLRGNAFENQQQKEYLGKISDILIVTVNRSVREDLSILDGFRCLQCDIIFLLSGTMQKDTRNAINCYLQSHKADSCSVLFIATTKKKEIHLGTEELRASILKNTKLCLEKKRTNVRTLLQICKQHSEMKCDVDEDSPTCQAAEKNALKVLQPIDGTPLHQVKSKSLQIETWTRYAEEKRKLKKDKTMNLMEKDNSLIKLRSSFNSVVGQNQSKLMILFKTICVIKPSSDDELLYTLQFLKFHLDDKFKVLQGDLTSNASFGIEDCFREIGQLYEIQGQSLEGKQLTRTVARMILLGFPFEIMNGDLVDIPLEWVKAVFEELNGLIQKKKVFTLSIIGLQSSGKSTLLNAMFGVSFPVSAGRCTRGIYMQLFPVSKCGLKFDYVIVLDTEGLRAPEEVHNQYQRDNELATLAIGMADLCIVNIFGENTSEVHNILQVCVHAFLRLKHANAKLCLNQSCIFTHQNVSAPNVNKTLNQQRMNLEEILDMLTLEAAQEENMNGVKHFRDVIGFNRKDHISYFPNLWIGDPPMAPVNPGYSRMVQIVKSLIFQKLATGMTAYFQTISELYVHLNDLWSGILANDFVFSFRNTLEIRAYKALQIIFRENLLNLESFVNSIDYLARISMRGYSSERELHEAYRTQGEEYTETFNKMSADLKFKLENYFKNGEYKKIINSWKLQQMKNWDLARQGEKEKMDTILYTLYLQKRDEFVMQVSLDEMKRELSNKAKTLAAAILVSKHEDKLDVDSCFEEMWQKQVGKLNIQPPESTDVGKCLCDELKHTFEDNHIVVKHEISSIWLCKTYETPHIVDAISWFAIDNSLATLATYNPFKQLAKAVLTNYHEKTILHFTKELFVHVDTIFDQLRQRVLKFDDTVIKTIFFYIRGKVKNFNQENEGHISFTETYIIRVAVFVCDFARPLLQRLDNEYRGKHSLQAQLDEHRDLVYRHFQDLTSQKTIVIVASNYVCNAIRTNICTLVKQELYDKIFYDSLEQCRSKENLLVKMLIDLAENNTFICYLTYLQDPRSYASVWLKHFVNDRCFTAPFLMYYIKASEIMERLFLQIKECVESNQEQEIENWLFHFDEKLQKILPTQGLSLDPLKDQKDLEFYDFKKTLVEQLVQMQNDLKQEFREVNENNIKWPGKTPYEKILDHIWGCDSVCPFCLEPCVLQKDHKEMVFHRCIQHRPNGLIMRFWDDSSKLSIENCNKEVGSNSTYECGPICTRGPPGRHEIGIVRKVFVELGIKKFHAYSDYKVFFPDWHIVSHPDISSSVYWAWVMCQYNAHFADFYDKKKADIPESWKLYTKQDALNSLPALDSL